MTTAQEDSLTTPVDETAEEAEADRLFAEAVADREGKPAKEPAEPEPDATAETLDEEKAEVTTGEGPGEEPSGQPGGGKGAAATAAEPGEGDIWADADPKLKAAYDEAAERANRAEQQFKSREGRESALQRQVAELRRRGTGEEQDQPRKPLKELLETDEIKALRDEYPDFAPLIDALAEAGKRVDGVSEEVGQVKTVAVSAGTAAEERALNQAVPNWLELARDDRFMGWVDDQPRQVRDTVSANWDGITNATEAAKVFKAFADHIEPPARQEEPAKVDEPEGGAPSKRQRQASGARGAQVNAPASAGGDSDDPEIQFAQAAAKKDRERGIGIRH